jgi:hypothetical protein
LRSSRAERSGLQLRLVEMNPAHAKWLRPALRADVLIGALILGFTALPTQLRMPNVGSLLDALGSKPVFVDVLANVLGYVPLGVALAKWGPARALLVAGALTLLAEGLQLFSVGRDPAAVDVAANFVGAGLGLLLAKQWNPLPDGFAVSPRAATLAAAAAIAYMAVGARFTVDAMLDTLADWLDAPPWMVTNPRGTSSDGRLEGHWSFNELNHDVVRDVSGHGLQGTTVNAPALSTGKQGTAILLDGRQWVDLGSPVPLRLTGSMTLSAWIRPTAFPPDDAAIISSHTARALGYQLDLTIDQGPRTIGFKLADASGRLMARYGKTPILLDHWYHVAGVYDAEARTLDVFVNGRRDNGCLMGTVSNHQQASGRHVFLGRRAGSSGFEFTGSIDEAQIQSRPLRSSEIEAEVGTESRPGEPEGTPGDSPCAGQREPGPPRVAGMLVLLGVAIALACTGLWRRARTYLVILALCLSAGISVLLWLPIRTALHPAWLATLYVLLGGVAVVLAGRQQHSPRE